MLLALADHLRCTADHAATWLVARADTTDRGRMVDGVLGCPVCHAERVVRAGIVSWEPVGTIAEARSELAGPAVPAAPVAPPAHSTGDEAGVRLAALLALTDAAAPYVLCGNAGTLAPALGTITDARLVLLDPPDDSAAGFATIIRGAPRIPFADASVRGIALDAAHAAPGRIDFAVRALVSGGRLVADTVVPVPEGIRELARDAVQWVGERVGAGAPPVVLRRARG